MSIHDDTETATHPRPIAVGPAEAARLAGIGRTSLYSALAAGELKSFRYGRRRLIRIAEIDNWLKQLEVANDAA